MISEEYYLDFLKCIISCVNNGDYYSIKELSVLELEKLKKKCISDKSNSKMLKWCFMIVIIKFIKGYATKLKIYSVSYVLKEKTLK